MKVTITIEDTPKGVTIGWREESSEVTNFTRDSLSVLLTAEFLFRLRQRHRLGILSISSVDLDLP
ncbi:hypothetical protein HJJEPNFP_00002 [Ralstonia phage BOESR1]|uniref:Uncharacterized protein n=1 Tax=Ralstonia phage BOESR1 TaxID=3034917 RepID=A0AA50F307_9CAUD|nr:hypothetical protein HJJEPNFP_00002 [Ralstonia phage BOESR1]WLW40581.1 hypothetical protein HIBIKMCM_00014 [Ralstonia phage BOESR1]